MIEPASVAAPSLNRVRPEPYEWLVMVILAISVVGLVLYLLGTFTSLPLVLGVLAVAGLSWVILRRPGESAKQVVHWRELILFAAIVALAIYLRLPVSNFIFWLGDAADYVNAANHLVMTGKTDLGFFPMNAIWLATFGSLFGLERNTLATTFFSVATVISIHALTKELFGSSKIALLALLVASINFLSVWHAKLPHSEVVMLFFNVNVLLFYIRSGRAPDAAGRLYCLILCCISVLCACFTRGTGIVWMGIFTIDALAKAAIAGQARRALVLFNAIFFVYLLSVLFGTFSIPYLYVKDYLGMFLGAATPRAILLWHAVWWLAVNLLLLACWRRKAAAGLAAIARKIDESRLALVASAAVFAALVTLGELILIRKPASISIVAMASDIAENRMPGTASQVLHYLPNFFSPASLVLIPLGLLYLLKKLNPFNATELSLLWIFCLIHFAFYGYLFSFDHVHSVHLVYLYVTRYFYSEAYLGYLLFFIGALAFIEHARIAVKSVGYSLLAVYAGQSLYLWNINRNVVYLKNDFHTIERIASVVPREKSVVFVNRDPKLDWLWPNVRQCILRPLHRSYLHEVWTQNYNDAFGPEVFPRQADLMAVLKDGKNAYVVDFSPDGDMPPIFPVDDPLVAHHKLDSFNSTIELKPDRSANIFHRELLAYPFHADILKYEARFPLYPSGKAVDFGPAGNSTDYVRDGWNSPENGSRWTLGNKATLEFYLDDHDRDLELSMDAVGLTKQRVRIWVNHAQVGELTINPGAFAAYSVSIPKRFVPSPKLLVELELPDAISPMNAGINPDQRVLALAVRTIRIAVKK